MPLLGLLLLLAIKMAHPWLEGVSLDYAEQSWRCWTWQGKLSNVVLFKTESKILLGMRRVSESTFGKHFVKPWLNDLDASHPDKPQLESHRAIGIEAHVSSLMPKEDSHGTPKSMICRDGRKGGGGTKFRKRSRHMANTSQASSDVSPVIASKKLLSAWSFNRIFMNFPNDNLDSARGESQLTFVVGSMSICT